ncbi:hypothetical protein NEILACOT_05553 [Neisseria lactamica ATCC 23970]|uniref:Uncharacterized protein n=1 Tax=Neisseria lactamica ATCC 23970 TaxID=546265 RepID=D0WDB7_NEILA|nr:hypothetical protein NEILACOT_05553 [Neisseria lactamica ATCC 23970]
MQTAEALTPPGTSCLQNQNFKFPKTIGGFALKRLIYFVTSCNP